MCNSKKANVAAKSKSDTACDATQPACPPKPIPKKDPSITFAKIIRGNPFVTKNATDAGLPPSIPPGKTYEIEITLSLPIMDTGQFVSLAIISASGDNGGATISPVRIQQTTTITITGGTQTKPGHAGQLKIEAKLDGSTAKGTSDGFSICAHPINYSDPRDSDINTPGSVGVRVQDGWESDSGTFANLDETEISEVVDYVGVNDSPPFAARGAIPFKNSGYLPGNSLTKDSHSIGRASISLGPAGISEALQLCIYKCKRCGVVDIALPKSGFKRVHEVFKDGVKWKYKTKKFGFSVTIGAYITEAGDGNAISDDHDLP